MSSNFGFLQSEWPEIYASAVKAESFVFPDPGKRHASTPGERLSRPCNGSTKAIAGCMRRISRT